ncbi:hypothetical protein [Tatumella morbirosei]|nr:hypothetical protein [Tatumella morbirosei]
MTDLISIQIVTLSLGIIYGAEAMRSGHGQMITVAASGSSEVQS